MRGAFEIGQSSKNVKRGRTGGRGRGQAEEGKDAYEEVRADLGKKTMERRETRHGKNKKGRGNLSVGRLMRQSRLTIKKQMKTFEKS